MQGIPPSFFHKEPVENCVDIVETVVDTVQTAKAAGDFPVINNILWLSTVKKTNYCGFPRLFAGFFPQRGL